MFPLFNISGAWSGTAPETTRPLEDYDLIRDLETFIEAYMLPNGYLNRQQTWNGAIAQTDVVLQKLISRTADMGAMVNSVSAQDELVRGRIAIVDKGVGRLIDADMSEESARLKALQTQQQLGTQALSIANGSADNILRLCQ